MKRDLARARVAERCWAVIGVLGGDRSCEILKECAHCRECEVISVAADELLARPLDEGKEVPLRTLDAALAAPTTDTGRRLSLVTFDVGGHALAIEVSRVVEVSQERPVRRVPHRSSSVFMGLVNVQGRLEPCFSLSAVLGLPPREAEGGRRMLVVGGDERRCAFLVDRVSLQEVELGAIAAPPSTVSVALDTHVRGIVRIANRPWSLLDAERLVATLERTLA